jgi:hypothetical protein
MKRRDSKGNPMKKFLFTLTAVILLVTALAGAASADDPDFTYVYPNEDGGTSTVPAGNSITLQWFWLATTKGHMNTFRRSFSASYAIYPGTDTSGTPAWSLTPAQAEAIWGPIQQTNPADWAIKCPKPQHWLARWETGGINLPAGTYTLVTRWTFSRPVNDGWHTCVDTNTGESLASPPSLYKPGSGTWTVKIEIQ